MDTPPLDGGRHGAAASATADRSTAPARGANRAIAGLRARWPAGAGCLTAGRRGPEASRMDGTPRRCPPVAVRGAAGVGRSGRVHPGLTAGRAPLQPNPHRPPTTEVFFGMSNFLETRPSGGTAASSGPPPAIEVQDLVKTYPGDVRALRGLSFTVEPGTVFGLLGPNGAGKSTTVKILTTLSRPDSGTARVAGIDVVQRPDRVRRAIGCVAQRSGVDLEATGRENLALQGRLYGIGGRELKSRVGGLLERFGLGEAADRITKTYSGGMRRKLDVALGLVHRPQALFLDEPTTGLDPEARADMWNEITRLASEEGITVLLTTHYLEEADRLARRLAIVDSGRVVAAGTPEELKAELRGDAILVELGEPEADGLVRGVLDRLPGVREVVVDGRVVRARVDSGATAVPAVLGALESRGLAVAAVTIARPSLDDVYLRYAGRAFSQADVAHHTDGDPR